MRFLFIILRCCGGPRHNPAAAFRKVLILQVYRMAEADIGCSLAEAAEAPAYADYLAAAAAEAAPALHVVYINTSLRTKALAHAAVPTITCTSSNVVATVLQARLCSHLARSCACLPACICPCCQGQIA